MAKKKSRATGRYIMCPGSNVLHGVVFNQVFVKEWGFTRCGCRSQVFLGSEWKPDEHGLSFEQVRQMYPGAAIV
jgi:hypothetical protein